MILDSNRIPGDLSASTIKALCHLAEVGEAKATELAAAAGFTTAACTGMIDRAEAAGWLARGRDPNDRRAIPVTLTPRGRALVEGMKPQPETADQEAA